MSAPVVSALDADQVKNVGIVAIIVVVVVGAVIARLVTKIVTRVLVIIVALVLAGVLYQQRQNVLDKADKEVKSCDVSFFGFHVTPSNQAIKEQCQKLTNR